MIKVFTAADIMQVEVVRGELESRGIPTMLKHESVRGQANVVGFGGMWPEVWVVNEADAPAAQQILDQHNNMPAILPWKCAQCGEEIDGSFDSCWNCGHDRPVSG
ncbi:MAG: hypothetical protein JWQ02_4494 [Capsulimonas sp.]|nr:hypothetical protein [Capsulimonas sp.]